MSEKELQHEQVWLCLRTGELILITRDYMWVSNGPYFAAKDAYDWFERYEYLGRL